MYHSIKCNKIYKGAMDLKIDLKKAFHMLDWRILLHVLRSFSFPVKCINLIMNCVTKISFSILWNGKKLLKFHSTHGLRQEDPVSPYLFVLCIEHLSLVIQKKMAHRIGNQYTYPETAPRFPISSLRMTSFFFQKLHLLSSSHSPYFSWVLWHF